MASQRERKKLGDSHGIRRLFDALDEQARTIVSEYYKRFQSLHNYIIASSLEEYLAEASRGSRGYGLWRYVLVEDSDDLPRASFDAMLAVWSSLLEVIECRSGRPTPVVMPDRRLSEAVLKNCPDAFREQIEQHDHPLNALADVVWKNYRNILKTGGSEEDIRGWLSKASSDDRDLSYLVMRARGQTSSGIGIIWNETSDRFETIPWNLPLIERKERPKALRTIECEVHAMRIALLMALHASGFSVMERLLDLGRADDRVRRSRDPRWQCTLKAEKHSGDSALIEVWENAADLGRRLHVKTSEGFEGHVDPNEWPRVELMGWTDA